MCAVVIWAVAHEIFTFEFKAFSAHVLGVEPQDSEYVIVSSRVAPSAATFTLTRTYCDCDGLVGLRSTELKAAETDATRLLAWLESL